MKSKLYFVWQGITGRYGIWKDGLWAAMKIIEKEYEVIYCEPTDEIPNDGLVLYWEAPCTINGENAGNYNKVRLLPNKKALLFAGGPIQKQWLDGFDHVFYESDLNRIELESLGIPCSLAFGINENIFYPKNKDKIYYGIHHGTCASWKRQWLVGESLGDRGLVVGRFQESDPEPFQRCRRVGCNVMDEKQPEELCDLVNESYACVQTSDYWGGGQRCTLEAMACNVPVICMSDSPKNREYVEESGFGLIIDPCIDAIVKAVEDLKTWGEKDLERGRLYVLSKWTAKHYANNLLKWIRTQ